MDFVDASGTRYQLTETAEAPAPAKKPVWPWVVGGLALAGGLLWMASSASRKANPVSPEIEALIAEARDPDTEWARQWNLFKHPEKEVRRALLDHPEVCPTRGDGRLDTRLLEDLAKEFPEEVANLPVFVLHALIEPNNEFQGVVGTVVERTEDVGLIERIWSTWGTSSGFVREAVAKNPSTPEDILRFLGNEKNESISLIRIAVAKNPSTPEDVLCALGISTTEHEWWVREALAENPNTPVNVLRSLSQADTERQEEVRVAAQNALVDRGLV